MNSEDLLCAISEADEDFVNESSEFDRIGASIKTERKKKQKRIAVAAAAFVFCLAIIGVFSQLPGFVKQPALVGEDEITTLSGNNTVKTDALTEPFSAATALPTENAADEPDVSGKTQAQQAEISAVIKQEPTAPGNPDTEVITAGDNQKGSSTVGSSYYVRWNGRLNMTGVLRAAIDENPGSIYAVLAQYSPVTAEITDFYYEGKTLSELAIAADNERLLPEKMKELLKWGDALKYGTALYETGTPTGEKWSKELYDDKVAYFGEELLGKYIVDGLFLRETLENDIAALPSINITTSDGTSTVTYYGDASAAKQYTLAYNAYLDYYLPTVIESFSQSGIKCTRDPYVNSCLHFSATESELENLPGQFSENWYFDLDSGDRKGTPNDGTVTN